MTATTTETEFTEFVRVHGRSLSRTAYMLCGDTQVAQDLLQEALARAFARWERIREANPHAYTRRILVNLTTDRWRRKRFEPTLGLDLERSPASVNPYDEVDDRSEIVAQLATLTPRERAVLVLRFYHDLTEQDTARTLGVSVGTVKSTTSRCLARLRSHRHDNERSLS